MTGQKGSADSTDLSSRLGVRRSKTTTAKPSKSSDPPINAPPKAALATARRFNDMLHPRSSKERERARRVSDGAATRTEATVAALNEGNGPSDEGPSDPAAQRVAELEQALATALEEQNTMKEELAKLREHGQVYRESIEEYRQTLASTYTLQSPPGAFHPNPRPVSARSNSYDDESAPRRSMILPREDLAEQNDHLRTKVAQLQDQLMTQEATYHSLLEHRRSRAEAEWDELTARLHATEKESSERLQQLLSLKSAFSSLTRVESQVTDNELSEAFSQLSNRVREWVISNYRRAKLNFSDIPQDTAEVLQATFPSYMTIDAANRLALFQAIVSHTLMHIFEEALFVGLPKTGPVATLRQIATLFQNTAGYQDWRHATIRSLQESDVTHVINGEKAQQIDRMASGILQHLHAITSTTLPPEARTTLVSILRATVEVQNALLLQKAQYRVDFPKAQSGIKPSLDDNRMEPINELDGYVDDDGDVVVDRVFAFCVFPCLEKFGDEYGEHTDVSNVLVKAKVCCSIG
ncbi:hypothetical protein P171DRAFT_248850 [Karstenula rhodostoma CBS 690.94]|uniref:Uncharacterized protein n=1 Tax=Karstenula rhodostoma CBS 690.94 TaxID=1392251 RepID=A0A9P4PNK8_9PLEO|nr:hypothetical protein P171DRAFT_248850 [Karstenula rhodostoma CBS 690.94]